MIGWQRKGIKSLSKLIVTNSYDLHSAKKTHYILICFINCRINCIPTTNASHILYILRPIKVLSVPLLLCNKSRDTARLFNIDNCRWDFYCVSNVYASCHKWHQMNKRLVIQHKNVASHHLCIYTVDVLFGLVARSDINAWVTWTHFKPAI